MVRKKSGKKSKKSWEFFVGKSGRPIFPAVVNGIILPRWALAVGENYN